MVNETMNVLWVVKDHNTWRCKNMSIEALSSTIYNDIAKPAQKTEYRGSDVSSQETGTTNISITETPAAAKVSNGNQPGSKQEKGQKDNATTDRQIKAAISKANTKMKFQRTRCEFSYHEETRRVSIKVLDNDTEEVIREIPPEEALEMLAKMWELAGLLVDEKR